MHNFFLRQQLSPQAKVFGSAGPPGRHLLMRPLEPSIGLAASLVKLATLAHVANGRRRNRSLATLGFLLGISPAPATFGKSSEFRHSNTNGSSLPHKRDAGERGM